MPPKYRRPTYKKKVYKKKSNTKAITAVVNKVLNKNVETKTSVRTSSDGVEIGHNGVVSLYNDILYTAPGTSDENSSYGRRIGDEIILRNASMKMMVELNERYSQATFRVFVIKAAKGDTPTATTIFMGVSNNKMLDNLNYERYTFLVQKTFTIRSAPSGITPVGTQTIGSGFATGTDTHSRATKIVTLNIKGSKFGKGGKVIYQNNSSDPKFYDYHVLLFGYSNYSTSASLGYNVGRINDSVLQLYYKDM